MRSQEPPPRGSSIKPDLNRPCPLHPTILFLLLLPSLSARPSSLSLTTHLSRSRSPPLACAAALLQRELDSRRPVSSVKSSAAAMEGALESFPPDHAADGFPRRTSGGASLAEILLMVACPACRCRRPSPPELLFLATLISRTCCCL